MWILPPDKSSHHNQEKTKLSHKGKASAGVGEKVNGFCCVGHSDSPSSTCGELLVLWQTMGLLCGSLDFVSSLEIVRQAVIPCGSIEFNIRDPHDIK